MKKIILVLALVPYLISPSFSATLSPNDGPPASQKRRLSSSSVEDRPQRVPSPNTVFDQEMRKLLMRKQAVERARYENLFKMRRAKQALEQAKQELAVSLEKEEDS
jgi:hypothetical protein